MEPASFPVRAKETCTAKTKSDLSFKKDDIIIVTSTDNQKALFFGSVKGTTAKGWFSSSLVTKELAAESNVPEKAHPLTKEDKKLLEQEKKIQEQKLKEAKAREKEEAKAREKEAKDREKAEAKRKKDEEREQKLREKESKRKEKEDKDQARARANSKARRLSRRVTKYKIQTGAAEKLPAARTGPIFGVPLGQLMYTSYTDFELPHLFVQSINFLQDHLKVEGLFRLSGSQAEITAWRSSLDAGTSVSFQANTNPHSVAGLMKLFLRSLPEPLFTFPGYEECEMIATIPAQNTDGRIAALASLLKQLPPTNKLLIVELIRFLGALSVFREVNKMGPANIGLVFGPNVIRRHEDDIDIRVPCEIIKFMVENHTRIVSLGGAKIQNTEEVVEHVASVYLPTDVLTSDSDAIVVDNQNFQEEEEPDDTSSSLSTLSASVSGTLPPVHALGLPPPPPPEQ